MFLCARGRRSEDFFILQTGVLVPDACVAHQYQNKTAYLCMCFVTEGKLIQNQNDKDQALSQTKII